MDNEDIKEKTYDKFRVWVRENLRKRPNEKIDTRAYSDLKPELHGPTHMAINLEHIVQGNAFLFDKIREYDPQAKIIQQARIEDTGSNFVAYIPYLVSKKKGKYQKKKGSGKSSSPPNSLYLYFYVFAMFLIIICGFVKTVRSDWKFLF